MKGIIFNLLEEVITEKLGPDLWDRLLDGAGLDGAYTSLGSYPDAEILALVDATASATDQSPEAVLHWFGRHALARLAVRYPIFFDREMSARDFVLRLNTIIHPEVRKLYAGAGCPRFDYREDAGGLLTVIYRSQRQLCDLAQGFLQGVGDHYDERLDISHALCMKKGDAACEIGIKWL